MITFWRIQFGHNIKFSGHLLFTGVVRPFLGRLTSFESVTGAFLPPIVNHT